MSTIVASVMEVFGVVCGSSAERGERLQYGWGKRFDSECEVDHDRVMQSNKQK